MGPALPYRLLRRRRPAPTVASPVSISIQVEGSGTGVKSKVSVLPLCAMAKVPPDRGFWKLAVLNVNSFALNREIEPAERMVHE